MVGGGMFFGMDISASALRAERSRMNVHANNLANAFTTHDADGNYAPYRRKKIMFKQGAEPITGSRDFGVSVDAIEDDYDRELIKRYEPGHPDADADGYVSYPNVHVQLEMVDMMVAQRAFEANVTAFEASKQLMRGALQIIA